MTSPPPYYDTHHVVVVIRADFYACMSSNFETVKTDVPEHTELRFLVLICRVSGWAFNQ